MQVFKTFMKIALRRIPTVLSFFVIYAVIVFIMAANVNSEQTGFESEKLKISVTDLDGSAASAEVVKYIEENHTLVDIGSDDESVQDALYYYSVDYVLTINEGFEEKLENGETDGLFENVKRDGTYTSALVDGQLTQLVSAATMYMAGGDGAVQACKKAREASEVGVDVTVETFGKGETGTLDIGYFTQYLGYIFVCIMVNGISPILMRLNGKDIRRRIDCSAISLSGKNLQIFAGAGVAVAAVWLAFVILETAVYKGAVFTETGLLCLLNSFVFALVSAGITVLVAQFNLNNNTVNMVSNVISLGMAFLCGVFVPQYLMASGVLAAARFLPAYWYVRANNMLCGFSDEAFAMNKYLAYLGIEMLFAAVLFAAAAVISGTRRKTAE